MKPQTRRTSLHIPNARKPNFSYLLKNATIWRYQPLDPFQCYLWSTREKQNEKGNRCMSSRPSWRKTKKGTTGMDAKSKELRKRAD